MPPEIVLTAEEQVELAAKLAELHAYGYTDIAEHGDLKAGARIRHSGHQWSEAYASGTGFVVAITEKPDSAWSRSYGKPDIELIAVWDKAMFGSRLSQLAQYHVHMIEVTDES